MLLIEVVLLNFYFSMIFFERIRLIFYLKNWLWKHKICKVQCQISNLTLIYQRPFKLRKCYLLFNLKLPFDAKVAENFLYGLFLNLPNWLKKSWTMFSIYLFNRIYIYSFTGWMLLPKRCCFISFFINIFVAMAESQITGTMITCMYRNSQVGYM